MLVILAVLIWLFWYFFHVEVRDVVRWIRYAEMSLISLFIDGDYEIIWKGKPINYATLMESVSSVDKEKLRYEHLALISGATMGILKTPLVIIMGAGALWCTFLGPNTQYRQKLDLEGLILFQSRNFPVISPFVKFNPAKQPPRPPGAPVPADLPLFAEALGPEEWLAYHSVPVPDGNVDKEAAADAFVLQLGKRWKGTKALDDYKKILLASFCLKASRKRTDADAMLGRLAKCWNADQGLQLFKDKKLLKEANEVLANKNLSGKTLAVANQHAFETTAMMRALAFAREEGGVLAPAQFVWLRGYDRTLWYPLNNMGRQSFHMEALGAMAHYKAEKITQRPIPVPKVENAVSTIVSYMKSPRARPIPQLDYSQSKKRGVKKAV